MAAPHDVDVETLKRVDVETLKRIVAIKLEDGRSPETLRPLMRLMSTLYGRAGCDIVSHSAS